MAKPENVRVNYTSPNMVAICWNIGEFRYHVWLMDSYNGNILFKNRDNDGLKTYDPNYYRTRKLDGNIGTNAAMIRQAKAIVDRDNLFLKAKAEYEAKLADQRDAQITHIRRCKHARRLFKLMQAMMNDGDPLARMELNGPDMLALLEFKPADIADEIIRTDCFQIPQRSLENATGSDKQ